MLTKFVSNAVLNPRAEKDGKKSPYKIKDDKKCRTTKKRWQKYVAPPKKDGKKKSHLQERWQKYVAPPKKSRIVKKKMTKKCRKIGQN